MPALWKAKDNQRQNSLPVPPPSVLDSGSNFWASIQPAEALSKLKSTPQGLDPHEVTARLKQYGPNVLPRPSKKLWYLELATNFVHLFALLLWAGAGLAWIARMPELAWAIAIVVLVNGFFSYWQEYQAEKAAEALAALLPSQVTVRRNGQVKLISTSEVVPGDILVLTEGEAIPADARLLVVERLRVDMSALTGESRPVPRIVESSAPDGKLATYLPNLVFAGTTVADGRGEALVFATGATTEFGRIAQLTNTQVERLSPLQKELRKVTQLVTILAVGFGVFFFILGSLLGGLSLVESFVFAVGIIVANVPEGLLPTLTLALAMGVRRMASRNALVKRLSAVETLGATTVILTDKTGTLTENEMTVRQVWAGGKCFQINGVGYAPTGTIEGVQGPAEEYSLKTLLKTAALCCDATLTPPHEHQDRWSVVGDPTEGSILVAATKTGLTAEELAGCPRIVELPFDSVRKRMTIIHEINGEPVACVKGAPSEIFPRCTTILINQQMDVFDESVRKTVQAAHDELASMGLRVLAVASRTVDSDDHEQDGWRVEEVERDLTFLGLLAMEDPPRPEVPAALMSCRQAGIKVVMVTGDNGLTASAIGREIKLNQGKPRIITGVELNALDEKELSSVLDAQDLIFARVSPEHKLRLVEAFQAKGEVVAVTGDGVNDAPALKRADIGVAMGVTGTDVAREASDMVLADDNFANIIAAIEEGRAVYDNVRKFLTYIVASNSAEMVPFIAFALFRIPLPLNVMQVLAVDLGTDLLPALALGAEPPEPDVMRRKPRARTEQLLNVGILVRAYAWLGMIEALFGFCGYYFANWLAGWRPGMPVAATGHLYLVATTMTLAGIVAGQVGCVFACRSPHQSIFRLGFTTNNLIYPCVAAEVVILLILIYFPPLAKIFGCAPLNLHHWLLLLAFPPLMLILEEIRKAISRKFHH